MRLTSIQLDGRPVYGYIDNDDIIIPGDDFLAGVPTLAHLLASGAAASLPALAPQARVALADAVFDPLIPQPGKIFCVGINFRAHMAEMGRPEPDYPWLFTRFADSQVGHGQPLMAPSASGQFDFEGELAVVIGKAAHHVSAEQALSHVAGYTCFMDGSLRDFQRHTPQFTPGKNFYQSGAFGPWLVTADEIPDPSVLNLQTRLNGEVMQRAPINDLKFDVPHLIEYISSFCVLQPGDVISTGTPGGVGFARDPQVWLRPGDALEVEVDGIGTLRNPVVAESDGA